MVDKGELIRKAELGDREANKKLGFMYFWGDVIPQNDRKSFEYMKKAADAGDGDAQAHVAQSLEAGIWGAPCKDIKLAKKYFDLALAQNNAHAQWCIGHNYKGGYYDYPQDKRKAFEYFLKSAENGSDKGQLETALCYINGEGIEKNVTEGIQWLEKSADQGNCEAMGRLGIALVGGTIQISQENMQKGYDFLLKAAAKGDKVAKNFLDNFNKELEAHHASLQSWTLLMLGGEAERNYHGVQAVKYYQSASELGCSQALSFLGNIYMHGMPDVPQNIRKAVKYLKTGAKFENADAQIQLGVCYSEGRGVPQNKYEAKKCFEKAAKQNKIIAKLLLADIYAEKPETYEMAEKLYKAILAAPNVPEEDLINTKTSLGILYAVQKKYSWAISLLTEAAESGNPNARDVLMEIEKEQNSNTMSGNGGQQQKNGGCYIATAVYGSYDCPEVWTLRRFRDHVLKKYWCGRIFIKFYYAVSPGMIRVFGNAGWFQFLWRRVLDKIVTVLEKKGIENTPYYDA